MNASRSRNARYRVAALATVAGLAILAAATFLARSWRDELPDPVATHWGLDGKADGFSSLNTALGVMLGFGVGLVLLFGVVTLAMGQAAVTRRIGAAAQIWSALFMSLISVGSLYIQRGLDDARDVGGIGGVLLVAILGSLVPAALVGALVPGDPHQPTSEAVAPDAPRARLVAGERTAWTGRIDAGPAIGIATVAVAILFGVVVLTRAWAMLIIVGLVVIVTVAMFRWVVHIDRTGLTVRSALRWPRIRVPLDEVVRADVIEVRPVRDFGGWGLRVGRGGRVGVVLRGGEALLVERTGGRSVAVTVDGAAAAAGVLNALADHARST